MGRLVPVGLLVALAACRPSLPAPETPLSATPPDALAAPSPALVLGPPRLPRPKTVVAGNGATLWMLTEDSPELRIEVVTRRGDDGAHPLGILDFALGGLRKPLRERHPSSGPYGSANLHGAYLGAKAAPGELEVILRALLAQLRDPGWDEADLERVRTRARIRLESLDDAVAAGALLAAADHLEGGSARLGRAHRPLLERLEQYTSEAMASCLRERFAAEDLVVVVAGPVDEAETRAAFEAVVGPLAAPTARRPAPERGPARPERALLSEVTRADRAHVLMAQEALPLTHEDRPAFEVLTELLGGTFTSLLNGSLREQHAYTYGAHAGISQAYYRDVLWVSADFQPERVFEALRELFVQLKRLRREPLTEAQIAMGRTRVWSRLHWRIEHARASVFRQLWWSGMTPELFEARYASLDALTPASAMALARRTLRPTRALLVVTGDFTRVSGFLVTRDASGFRITED